MIAQRTEVEEWQDMYFHTSPFLTLKKDQLKGLAVTLGTGIFLYPPEARRADVHFALE